MQEALKSFQRVFQILLFVLTGLVLLLFIALFSSRLMVNDQLKETVEFVASDAAGLAIEVGQVRGDWWSGLTLHDVVVHSSPDPKSGVLGKVPLVQVDYTLASFFGTRPTPIRVDVYHPRLTVVVGKDKLFNIQPKVRAPHEDPPLTPAPPVDMVFHSGSVTYTDHSARQPFVAEVHNANGTGRLRGFDLRLELQALREADLLKADVTYDLKTLKGHVEAHGTDVAPGYWLDRFAYAPEYRVTGGKADVDVTIDWRDPMVMDELKLKGNARLNDVTVKLRDVQVPVTRARGTVSFDAQVANVERIDAELAGMPITVTGQARSLVVPDPVLGIPDPALALTVVATQVDLGQFPALIKDLKDWKLAGVGTLEAEVRGTSQDPRVALRAWVPAGLWDRIPLSDFYAEGDYRKGRLDVPAWRVRLAGGTASGRAEVDLPEDPEADLPYRVAARFSRIALDRLLAKTLDEPLPVALSGAIDGDWSIDAVGERARVTAHYNLTDGKLQGKPVQAFHIAFEETPAGWKYPAIQVQWAGSELVASAEGRKNGPFTARFKLPQGELANLVTLMPEPLDFTLSGPVSGAGEVRGDASGVKSWVGGADVRIGRSVVREQPLDAARLKLALKDNRLAITEADGRMLGGRLEATGTVTPFLGEKTEIQHGRYAVRLRGLKPGLVPQLPPDMRALGGRADADLDVRVDGKQFVATGQAVATGLNHPHWGYMETLEAKLTMREDQLTLHPLTWHQGKNQTHAEGTLTLGPTPSWDLRVWADHADVATLLGAAHWSTIAKKLDPRSAARAARGPEQSLLGLPGQAPPLEAAALNLTQGLAHWSGYHKLPLDRPPPAPPLMPFWEGTRGDLTFDARISGTPARPRLALKADVRQLQLFDRPIDELQVNAVWTPERLILPMARLQEKGRTVVTAGGIFSNDVRDELVIKTHGFDLGWSDRFLVPQRMRLGGQGDVRMAIRGPFQSPRVTASGTLTAGRFQGPGVEPVPFDQIAANVAYERGTLAIADATLRQNGHQATLSGRAPVGGNGGALDLALKLQDGNLAILNLFSQGRFQWLSGKGLVELNLGGTTAAPQLAGRVQLTDGKFTAKGLDTPVEGFETDIVLNDQKIDIRSLKGRYGGGDLEIAGEVFWHDFQPERLNVTAQARPFRLNLTNNMYEGMVEADLRLSGPVASPALSGLVALWDGTVTLKDPKPGQAAAQAAPPVPLRLNNLNISLGPSFRLKNAVIDVAATTQQRAGFLVVDGTVAAPKPRGVVLIESGTIRPLNNPFKIVEGRVEFLGEKLTSDDDLLDILGPEAGADAPQALNAKLDIQAQTVAYDYQVDETVNIAARVTGSLDRMEMRFTSEPIRSEQEILDILSKKQVLAGTFNGRLDGGQVIVQEVGGLVTSNIEELVSPYTLALRNVLNLQTLRFELVADYTKQNTAAIAGFKPALLLETRPIFERLSLGSRLVAGEFYDTSPQIRTDNTYVGMNLRLNRRLSMEYRVDPFVDTDNQRVLAHWLGLKASYSY